jgi:anhydro-N-acetylmuramic acid kinase
MSDLALGLMSGTSADGVSAALVSFSGPRLKTLGSLTLPYPRPIAGKVLDPEELSLAEISALDFSIGEVFAQAALRLLAQTKTRPDRVTVIGSHGQTLHHSPRTRPAHTLQLGKAAVIAERTGITVVSDFRPRDIAAGGEGAPLLPFFDQAFFGGGPARALQNIGGIANVSIVGRGIKRPLAFDNGPGNTLLDWAVRKITHGRQAFDRGGALALRGMVRMEWIRAMNRHPYFRRPPPKSTGKELFNPDFLPEGFRKFMKKSPHDALRTLAYFTAYTIAESYRRFVLPRHAPKEMIVSGGGVLNAALLHDLASLLPLMKIVPISEYGIGPQDKEPAAFAFFALEAVRGRVNHLPEGTGARRAAVLGKITPGLRFRGLA